MPELRSGDILAEVLKSGAPAESGQSASYEPPQGELEEKLARAWADALNRSRVSRNDDFFDLGGDSIAAVQLIIQLQEIVPGEMLPLRAILEAPTVEQFAKWLKENQEGGKQETQQVLVQLKQGSSARPPFFCVHAPDGTAIGMQPLASTFADDLPFYCLQGKGLDGSEPYQSVEEAAEYCLSEIQKVQPAGPYYLGGFCFGGFVAFEMARMLAEKGERVPLLVIIDGFNPAFLRGKTGVKMLSSLGGFYFRRLAIHARKLASQGPVGWFGYIGGRVKAVFVHAGRFKKRLSDVKAKNNLKMPDALASEPGEAMQIDAIIARLEPLGRALAAKWTPKPYDGDAMVFRVSERSDDPYEDYYLGWRKLIKGKLESYEVESTHETILFEPAVGSYGGRIDEMLREKARLPKA